VIVGENDVALDLPNSFIFILSVKRAWKLLGLLWGPGDSIGWREGEGTTTAVWGGTKGQGEKRRRVEGRGIGRKR
jgi:hypothetical protein